MRKIKFRAINHETGKFVYGYYIKVLEGIRWIHYIIEDNIKYYIHDLKTLGQFTGLKDKNGKEIYEGDVVEGINTDFRMSGIVEFNEGAFEIVFYDKERERVSHLKDHDSEWEVIGNIYENPELLK